MTIRLAVAADVPRIMQIIKEVVPLMRAAGNLQWSEEYPNLEVFERDSSLNQLWVAEVDGIIVGVSAITTDQEEEYMQAGWDITETAIVTHRLAVSPHYSGLGIAAALLNKAEQIAHDRGIKILRIDTSSQNQITKKLFPKLGYILSGEISLRFRPGQRFLCYEKRLE